MVHKYCLLVKNHSMKGYSLLIQKVLVRIDSDLTADLSLKTQAALLNVNASYLSTLFKKETGQTLTDYVNKKRVEHALFLLNSSSMQIPDNRAVLRDSGCQLFYKDFQEVCEGKHRKNIGMGFLNFLKFSRCPKISGAVLHDKS